MRYPVLAAATALAASAAALSQAPAPAGDAVARGKAAFVRVGCYQCHNYAAQGGLSGPRLAPDPLPTVAIAAYVRHPAGVMPAYSEKVLPDATIADIRAYLVSLPKPPADIPLLRRP